MPARQKLGEQYVRFSVDGLKESENAVQKTAQKNEVTWGNMAKSIKDKFKTAMAGAFAVAAPVAGLYAMARSASEGTREGEHMATAWKYLSLVIGEQFAPAMRTATTLIVGIADAIRTLSPETKMWIAATGIASIGLLALGTAATVVSVAFTGLAATAGLAWAVITAPITLLVAKIVLIVGAVAAVAVGILYLVGRFADAGSAGEKSAKTWAGAVVNGARVVTTNVATAINFMTKKFAEGFNWIAEKGANIMERAGFKETAEKLRGMKMNPEGLQISVDELNKMFDKAQKWADSNVPGLDKMKQKIKEIAGNVGEIPEMLKELFAGNGAAGPMKFQAKFDVKFESLQSTFDRLQEAFAKGPQEDQLDQIRDEGKKTNEILNKILDKIGLGSLIGP